MKLNAAEIREIEKFLTAREDGLTNGAIAAYFGINDHGAHAVCMTYKALAAMGVRVAVVKRGPKARPARPAAPAQPVRLSAEQWQERLSAHGF